MRFFPLLVALALVTLSLVQLTQTVYTSSLTYSLSQYSDINNADYDSQRVDNERLLVSTILSLPNAGAHQYELAANILSWHSYLNYNSTSDEEVKQNLLKSIHLRPTWYAPYVQLHRLFAPDVNSFLTNSPQDLASRFGPYMNETKMMLYDIKFSQWEALKKKEQVELTTQFLTSARSFRFRDTLKALLDSSKSAQRMCKLLAFNDINHASCRKV
ncbi:hypothetical protein VITU102760_12815 [Vibrio tubiashii]|uniref:Uncharacterized protein n=1 Tax=Vibrio tubiashii ATCC 19109 TaxID=1051646 RepID=F9TBG4_9VIBR|nr:hypothetical protein [Vibrio tubiashii]AIW16173.1 hypothetical protein IX91_18925 [Vibrio tubiashii ATCC 19109]EGU48941.1 hypothetical protein VITU9109_26498 [Vibrio tubiashii ATCC 19109]EIF03490.1 hypothetical protein VT1337_12532 [Vibrio tubiashii NCIMB 1337 = ATCC 19106]MCG9579346.1 hypothetical protein [Vibrio tubiashii]